MGPNSLVLLLLAIIGLNPTIYLFRMSSLNIMVRWTLLALAVLVMTLSQTSAKPTAQAEGGNQPGEMTNALNYLAELDKYYSNVARPSIDMLRVRRVNQNLSSALEKLSAIKNYYSEMGRSRFGKRSSPAMMSSRNPYEIYVPAAYDE